VKISEVYMITTDQASIILGVKGGTVGKFAQRGLLHSKSDGIRSWYEQEEVERLAAIRKFDSLR